MASSQFSREERTSAAAAIGRDRKRRSPQHHPVSDSELVPLGEAKQAYTRAVAGEGIVFRNDNDNEPYAPAFASKLDLDEFKRALLAHNMPALEKITGYAVHVPAGSAVSVQSTKGKDPSRSVLVNITSGPLSGMNGLWMYSKYVVQ